MYCIDLFQGQPNPEKNEGEQLYVVPLIATSKQCTKIPKTTMPLDLEIPHSEQQRSASIQSHPVTPENNSFQPF